MIKLKSKTLIELNELQHEYNRELLNIQQKIYDIKEILKDQETAYHTYVVAQRRYKELLEQETISIAYNNAIEECINIINEGVVE